MQRIHLLRVEAPVAEFTALFESAASSSVRLGWLEWRPGEEIADGTHIPAAVCVCVGADGARSVRPRRGTPVLHDVVRRHFLGCRAVLVDGEVDAALLEPRGEGYRVTKASRTHDLPDAATLLDRLRRPRPWG